MKITIIRNYEPVVREAKERTAIFIASRRTAEGIANKGEKA